MACLIWIGGTIAAISLPNKFHPPVLLIRCLILSFGNGFELTLSDGAEAIGRDSQRNEEITDCIGAALGEFEVVAGFPAAVGMALDDKNVTLESGCLEGFDCHFLQPGLFVVRGQFYRIILEVQGHGDLGRFAHLHGTESFSFRSFQRSDHLFEIWEFPGLEGLLGCGIGGETKTVGEEEGRNGECEERFHGAESSGFQSILRAEVVDDEGLAEFLGVLLGPDIDATHGEVLDVCIIEFLEEVLLEFAGLGVGERPD